MFNLGDNGLVSCLRDETQLRWVAASPPLKLSLEKEHLTFVVGHSISEKSGKLMI